MPDDFNATLRRHAAAQACADLLRQIEDPGFCSHCDLATDIAKFCEECAAAGLPLAAEDIAQKDDGSRLAAEVVRLAAVPGKAPDVKHLLDAATASDRLWDEMWRVLLDLFRRRVAALTPTREQDETTAAKPEAEQAEVIDEKTRQGKIARLPCRIRKAWKSYQAALSMAEKREMEDGDAYQLLKEEGIPDGGELTDYRLPAEETWFRYLGTARRELGEQKYTSRRGRPHGKSIVRQDQIEHPDKDDE